MPTVELEAEAVRQQLERILGSAGFARNERLTRFLQFIVDGHLAGRDQELKESVIGVEVFRREPGYNPQYDPIVRTEARRLRARLGEYYKSAGAESAVVVEMPKGGYVPLVRLAAQGPESSATSRSWLRRWRLVPLAFVGLAVLLAAIGYMRPRLAPPRPAAEQSSAYALFLRARASEMRRALSGVEDSIDLFEQAIAKDPSFAPAYAGLAAMEADRSGFDRFTPSERAEMIAKGWAAAMKAIQLDPGLADAYDAMGMMQSRQAQWEQAERSFRRAVELAPRDPLWRDHFAMSLLLPLGRIQEAIDQLRSAEEIDPSSLEIHFMLAMALDDAGRFADADFHCRKGVEKEQQMSVCWVDTLLRQGKAGEAVRIAETTWSGRLLGMGAASLGVAYAAAGRREDAERLAALVPRPITKATIFAALGDKDRTLELLDQLAPTGPVRIGRTLIAPEFALLRGDPRLKALRKKVGLPE
jgi:tetratricopeptide (TPR) repeat protein